MTEERWGQGGLHAEKASLRSRLAVLGLPWGGLWPENRGLSEDQRGARAALIFTDGERDPYRRNNQPQASHTKGRRHSFLYVTNQRGGNSKGIVKQHWGVPQNRPHAPRPHSPQRLQNPSPTEAAEGAGATADQGRTCYRHSCQPPHRAVWKAGPCQGYL